MKTPRQYKLLAALEKNDLTAKEIGRRFKLANPSAAIDNLRKAGYNINSYSESGRNGLVTHRYALA